MNCHLCRQPILELYGLTFADPPTAHAFFPRQRLVATIINGKQHVCDDCDDLISESKSHGHPK